MQKIQVGDTVQRKGDPSGRTRIVADVQTDAAGAQHVTLNAFLDGWLIWDARKLEIVARASETNLQKDCERKP